MSGAVIQHVTLVILLIVDIVLESLAIEAAKRILPTATKVLDARCFELLQEPPERDSLLALKSVCLSIVNIGVVQLLLAVFATLGSVRDLFDLGNMREDDEKPGRLVAVNSSFIFVPAALDILLAALDFAIFTQQARAETEALATRSAADSHSHLMLLLEPHPLPTASRVGATYGASRSWTSARSSA